MALSTDQEYADGKRVAYGHVYAGKFRDRNNNITSAGILTYSEGDTVDVCLRQPSISAPIVQLQPTVEKFRTFTDPPLGAIRSHYGKYNDPRDYELFTHGVKFNEKDNRAKDAVNPKLDTNFDFKKREIRENIYLSHRKQPLGRMPVGNLPRHIDPLKHTFGVVTSQNDNARDVVNPNKTRDEVELESSAKHEMYCFSHNDYEPGEQKNRRFLPPFNKNTKYGVTTPVFYDGRQAKEAVDWLPQKLLERRATVDSKGLDNFREKHTHQVGKPLDPNRDTRLVGPDHVFGLTNVNERFGAADIMHGRPSEKALRGRERIRAYIASVRAHLGRYNYTKFKTLVDAFKFFDQDKDGFISKDEFKIGCVKSGFPIADDLVDAVIQDCDYDADDRLNFLEFSNFLCFKESMQTGIKFDPNDETVLKAQQDGVDFEIKDDDGRVLLKQSDLKPKNNVIGNELVPRTLANQIDSKIGTWKTTYDIINEAPFRNEPIRKRVYGIPSIRNDLVAPVTKKIQDKQNYGDDGNGWSLLQPSVFSQHGIYENDVLQPRPKEEIRKIFRNIGVEINDELFENVWATASSQNPYGEVSVEEFRSVLDEIKTTALKASRLICA